MPELPEVETVVREIRAAHLVGSRINGVWLGWPPVVAPLSPARFTRILHTRHIEDVQRRAKYICLSLSGGWTLLVHLRMTGQLSVALRDVPRDPHQHLILCLTDGRELRYRDTRKFGRWLLTRQPEQVLEHLGPEPLTAAFTFDWLADALRKKKARRLKPLLLDQTFLAGLGNIYVDEALWAAHLHPLRRADTLSAAETRALRNAIRHVLVQGIRHGGTTLGEGLGNFNRVTGGRGGHQRWLRVFRRVGQPCRRCGCAIQRMVVAQRGTHICPKCQHEN